MRHLQDERAYFFRGCVSISSVDSFRPPYRSRSFDLFSEKEKNRNETKEDNWDGLTVDRVVT